MDSHVELPPIHPEDSVGVLIDRLIEGLKHPSGDEFGDEYSRIRAILRRHPLLKNHLPDFLGSCKTIQDYRKFMETRYSNGFEWDSHAGNLLSQLHARLGSGTSLEAYVIQNELGWGGFGRVYLAHHNFLERKFAIKFFQPFLHQGGGSSLSRFFQEAGMLYDLNHPNIVTIREVGMYRERPFFVMDYFKGVTLNEALKRQGSMPPDKCHSMIGMVASAIDHAHQNGILHRDLTPSNIMLKPGHCKVIDFGLGVYVEQQLRSRLTTAGEVQAGGHYTAPELLSDPLLTDPISDVYSIGAVWYTALTNRVPAGTSIMERLKAVPGLPGDHERIILRCLSDIGRRYSDCTELLAEIQADKRGEA